MTKGRGYPPIKQGMLSRSIESLVEFGKKQGRTIAKSLSKVGKRKSYTGDQVKMARGMK